MPMIKLIIFFKILRLLYFYFFLFPELYSYLQKNKAKRRNKKFTALYFRLLFCFYQLAAGTPVEARGPLFVGSPLSEPTGRGVTLIVTVDEGPSVVNGVPERLTLGVSAVLADGAALLFEQADNKTIAAAITTIIIKYVLFKIKPPSFLQYYFLIFQQFLFFKYFNI